MISIFSLLLVTPIVTTLVIYDWNRVITAVDNSVPATQRNTVRALAREIDDKIAGLLRGRNRCGCCLSVFGTYYAIALWSLGLNSALLRIRLVQQA